MMLGQPTALEPDFPPLDETALYREKGLDHILEGQGFCPNSTTNNRGNAGYPQMASVYLSARRGSCSASVAFKLVLKSTDPGVPGWLRWVSSQLPI